MSDQRQLLKGILEGCILHIIKTKPAYGYGIIETLRQHGFPHLKEGTVYPLLMRLEQRGMLQAELVPSDKGPARKYYSITAAGEENLNSFTASWQVISSSVGSILQSEAAEES